MYENQCVAVSAMIHAMRVVPSGWAIWEPLVWPGRWSTSGSAVRRRARGSPGAHRGEQAQFGVDGLAIAHAVSVNALPSARYAGVASTTLKGVAVCATPIIRNPACPSSALYSAAVRSRPGPSNNISKSTHLPRNSRSCSGITVSSKSSVAPSHWPGPALSSVSNCCGALRAEAEAEQFRLSQGVPDTAV